MSNFCVEKCKHLSITEKDQVEYQKEVHNSIPHSCNKFNTLLFHKTDKPNINRCDECKESDAPTSPETRKENMIERIVRLRGRKED